MKQLFIRPLTVAVLVSSFALASSQAQAMTPSLSLYATSSGDNVAVSVSGDSFASVILYYQRSGYGLQSQNVGLTNGSGFLSTTISTSAYGITAGSNVYVVVNNQTSSSIVWPNNYVGNNYNNYNYGNTYGTLSLSQTSVSVAVGQSSNITIYGGSAPYTMYPTGANVFQPVISGTNLQVTGLANGTGSVNICSSGGQSSGCVVLYVTVSTSNYYNGSNYYNNYNQPVYNNPVQSAITFSQTTPTLAIGQVISVSVSGGNAYNYYSYSGAYNIAYNSNSSALSAMLNGSTLTLQGLTTGNVALVICSNSTNCSALNVIVGATNYNYTNYGSGNWSTCASENGYCSFSGTQNVRYGANGVYVYRVLSNGTTCSNAIFGDPIFGVAKQCSVSY